MVIDMLIKCLYRVFNLKLVLNYNDICHLC
jgi:hypothetical protein